MIDMPKPKLLQISAGCVICDQPLKMNSLVFLYPKRSLSFHLRDIMGLGQLDIFLQIPVLMRKGGSQLRIKLADIDVQA